ncbi:MAG: hypothetical protein Tsb0032_07930 [Kiloniellaceae bacterium]
MVQFRGDKSLGILVFLVQLFVGSTGAQEAGLGLYDRPVLVLDPGMHTANISSVDTDASGMYAATGGDDKTIRVWSLRDGSLLHTVRLPSGPGDTGKLYAIAMSPDGDTIAVGGFTGIPGETENIYLIDRESGDLLDRIAGLPASTSYLTFSPDGRYLAAMLGGLNELRVFSRDSNWEQVAQDSDYNAHSLGAAFSGDGRLATSSVDGYLRLYDEQFRLIAVQETSERWKPVRLSFNPDGTTLALGYEYAATVSLFDGRDLSPLPAPAENKESEGGLATVAWSNDGSVLFSGGNYGSSNRNSIVAWSSSDFALIRAFSASQDTITSLKVLPSGNLLVAASDPYLAVFTSEGKLLWELKPQQADFRSNASTLSVSDDGSLVEFNLAYDGQDIMRFDISQLKLGSPQSDEDATTPPDQTSLKIEYWRNYTLPTLDESFLGLSEYETSRSLAIHPDEQRFVLGSEWWLYAFDSKGQQLWRVAPPGIVWAVNISGDGRLVVAAYGDGTIRWHRMDDGHEILAFFPLADRRNWVAWTPEGIYAATAGAHGVLRWHVNQGWDQEGEAVPVHEIPETRRPEVIRLVVQEMGTPGAIAVAELAKIREAIQRRTGTAAPGARLHILTIGVSDYGDAAKHLRLKFAAQDANDLAAALLNTQASLYAEVKPQLLHDKYANRRGILNALKSMREAMAQNEPGRDLAVIHFSGHGALIDGEFYLLPYDVNAADQVAIIATALPASVFRKQLAQLGQYGRVLVLLDACHSGGAMANGEALPVDASLLGATLVGSNITVLTSSTSVQLSREDPLWGNGAFTEILLEALGSRADSNSNGLISVSELTGYLTRHVRALTGGAQVPGVEMRFDGDVFVAGL